MKFQKLMTALTAIILSVTLITGGWAKPDKDKWKDNKRSHHSQKVSRSARKKDGDNDRKHGKRGSRVTRHKWKKKHSNRNNKRYSRTRRYRTVRRYNRRTGRYENVRRWSYWDRDSRTWRRE